MVRRILWAIILIFTSFTIKAQDSIPELNRKIVQFIDSVMNTKVDRGECWDLANRALTMINADWDHEYKYGKALNPSKDIIYPGDIIQFEGVKVKYQQGNTTYTEMMEHHTAIVYKVYARGVYELAHQNTNFSGRKVGLSKLDINTITKGKIKIYRPTLSLK